MFIDECTIEVIAGKGGDGSRSLRREKFVPKGGPDGGDGGHGGHVLVRVTPHLRTLSHLRHTPIFRAGSGRDGAGKQMTGAGGADAVVLVPPGTIIVDAATGEWIADAVQTGEERILAHGGRGGRGNIHFKSAQRRTPRFAEPGRPGEQRRLRLTLKLLADVGLVGLPNAGKSTLLARISNARPKVADYPFTTLDPVLGIVPFGEFETFVFADLPGLIAGAHEGRGLGQRFLRHVERTRVLLILIEAIDPQPETTLNVLRSELEQWSPALGARDSVVCYSKGDLLTGEARAALQRLGGGQPPVISAATGEGIDVLLRELHDRVLAAERGSSAADSATDVEVDSRLESEPAASAGLRAAGGVVDRSSEPPFDWRAAFGDRPWPTRWVIPARRGAKQTDPQSAKEKSSGRTDEQ